MDHKTLQTLEYPKILERLASYCAFSASAEKARALLPTNDLLEARRRQALTGEALQLLNNHPDLTIGGVRDVRPAIDLANHGGVLLPNDLLDIKSTLIASRNLVRLFERVGGSYPILTDIAFRMPSPTGLIDAITRTFSERGEILDSASEMLGKIRRELRVVHDRLLTRLQRMVGDPKNAPFLQEALITQRDGRYVLPLRSEFKGRIKSIVHDQSSSGATLFVEPLVVVELNNQYREHQLAERDEERRILTELSYQVATHGEDILLIIETVAELDMTFACAKYADDLRATLPSLQPFQPPKTGRHPGSLIRLYQARHPLLEPNTVVPVDVELDARTYAMVITGPNTGGKTVTLKTVGLLALMAQAGLHIPALSGSELSVFHAIFADIGDEQSIEQSLSTFSGHITNIIHILENANPHSLIILDELGAGTDPQEGAALARALLDHVLERSITTLVTTHHPELKAYAHSTPGVVNASVEFDLETLRPSYHLTIGLPGRSNALAIAQRLGMPEKIITSARSELSPTDIRAEDLLDEIHRQRDLSIQARLASEKAQSKVEELRAELVERLASIEDERQEVLENARAESEQQLQSLADEMEALRRQLTRTRQPVEEFHNIEEKVAELKEKIEKPAKRRRQKTDDEILYKPVQIGDTVRLRTLNIQGVVTSLDEDEAEVQVGILRVRAHLPELQPIADEILTKSKTRKTRQDHPAGETQVPSFTGSPSPGFELDLRGQRADEALDALEQFLDSAYLASLPFVRIIHGKGTGRLRQTVRQALHEHPHVSSHEAGSDKEGGDGVTIAKLKTS